MKTSIFTAGLLSIILMGGFSLPTAAQCCVAPVNTKVVSIGKTEADLKWSRVRQTGCTTPVKYIVQYRHVGTTTWLSVTVRTPQDDKFGDTTVTGLLPSTAYQWRVRGICSSTNKTAWVAGPNFTTLAAPIVSSSSSSAISSSLQGKLTVAVSPNPVRGELNVTLQIKTGGPVDIQIVNSIGQSVINHSYNLSPGNFNTKIDVSKLPTGVYFVIANNKTEKASINIVKE